MPDWLTFIWIVVGVILSVAVPVAARILRPSPPTAVGLPAGFWARLATVATPYVRVGLASVVVGFLTLVYIKYTGGEIPNWPTAVITGYLWDATLQKLREGLQG